MRKIQCSTLFLALTVFFLNTPLIAKSQISKTDKNPVVVKQSKKDRVQLEWIDEKTIIATKKKDYIYIVWDIFSIKSKFTEKELRQLKTLLEFTTTIAGRYGFNKYKDINLVKIRVVSFNERDEYQGPRWDKMEEYGRYKFKRKTLEELDLLNTTTIPELTRKQIKRLLKENEK